MKQESVLSKNEKAKNWSGIKRPKQELCTICGRRGHTKENCPWRNGKKWPWNN